MIVIPAIDIKSGRVVRLAQGVAELETVYSESPLEIAEKWAAAGAKLIHVVDLDGALQGEIKNLKAVREILKYADTGVQMGGGIRDIGTIERLLDAGVEKVCIGTRALDEGFLAEISKSDFRKTVIVSIDAKDGYVHTKGWVERTGIKAVDLAKEVAQFGIGSVNYTDISRDGMLEGPNIASLRAMLKVPGLDIVAAGGVSTIGDVRSLKALEKNGLKGMIIGKALYEERIDLSEAMEICKK